MERTRVNIAVGIFVILGILALGYLLPMCYLVWSMRYGKVAGPNPWPSTGLEWRTDPE